MKTPDEDSSGGNNGGVDLEIRRQQLEMKIRELGGVVGSPPGTKAPPDLVNAYLERVLAWEERRTITHREWFARRGWRFPAPETLRGAPVAAELWRLIRALGEARVFLEHTDHLNDAELYARLWHDVLGADDAEDGDAPRSATEAWHWDLAEAGGHETDWLTYYADDDEREEWRESFPGVTLPAHRPLPHQRDHRLPKWQ
jgi:hypothetical protein